MVDPVLMLTICATLGLSYSAIAWFTTRRLLRNGRVIADNKTQRVKAIQEGAELFHPQKPATIAKSIAIGNPADGYYVIKVVNESGGYGASASDGEILDAIKLLAGTEGIFTEPAGGTTLACAIKLIESGHICRDESVVVCITGNGLKTVEAMQGRFNRAPVIAPKLKEFDDAVEQFEQESASTANTDAQTKIASPKIVVPASESQGKLQGSEQWPTP